MTKQSTAAPKPLATVYRLEPARVYGAGHLWQDWQVAVPPSITSWQQLCHPDFWSMCATKFKPLDVLHVVTDDGRVSFTLRVLHVSPNVLVAPIHRMVLGCAGDPHPSIGQSNGITVEYDVHHKYHVVKGDKVLRAEFETAAAAWSWLAQHVKQSEAA